jgi:import inner membrane translocase subunit TIM10
MTNVCQKKCIAPTYRESELSKGESVCIDRCVAKYFDIHDRIGKKLTALTQEQQKAAQSVDPGKAIGSY